MNEFNAHLLVDCQNVLGEGVRWNVELQRVFWVDIEQKQLWSCDEQGGSLECLELPERLCAFAFDPDGNLLAAFASGIYRLHLKSLVRDLLTPFEEELPDTRLNDGACDSHGRFIVGGFYEGPGGMLPRSSVISFDGAAAKTLIRNVACANSICFSADCSRMYFAETATKEIFRYDYDLEAGTISGKTLFARLTDEEGFPDGSAVDRDDALWNARFSGGRVQQYRPDGSPGDYVSVPASNVTCACFGGTHFNKLFITTARVHLDSRQLQEQPAAGGLFVAETGSSGRPEYGLAAGLFH